jgi:hypothetical protein
LPLLHRGNGFPAQIPKNQNNKYTTKQTSHKL